MSGKSGLETVLDGAKPLQKPGEDVRQLDLMGGIAHAPGAGGNGAGGNGAADGGGQVERTGKPGRPAGSRNRSTAETVRYLQTFGQGPLVGMARIVNMVDLETGLPDFAKIGRELGMDRADAAEFWLKCADKLAPYMHQKLPMAVDVRHGADREILIVNLGATIDDDKIEADDLLGGAFGGIIEHDDGDQ